MVERLVQGMVWWRGQHRAWYDGKTGTGLGMVERVVQGMVMVWWRGWYMLWYGGEAGTGHGMVEGHSLTTQLTLSDHSVTIQ